MAMTVVLVELVVKEKDIEDDDDVCKNDNKDSNNKSSHVTSTVLILRADSIIGGRNNLEMGMIMMVKIIGKMSKMWIMLRLVMIIFLSRPFDAQGFTPS